MVCWTAVPPSINEKLSPPGKLLKNAPDASTVSVTGTVIDICGFVFWSTVISPVYVPAGSVLAFCTLTVSGYGVLQE